MSCKYKDIVKCKECTHVFYRECPLFMKAHTAYLVRSILPFKMESQPFKGCAVWSTDINKAKSAAAKYAMKSGSEVNKLTVSQVLSLVLDGADLTGTVFYIEASTKQFGDPEKIVSVINSFIDKVLQNNGYVSLFLSPATNLRLPEYTRL